MGLRIRVYARRMTAQHEGWDVEWDPQGFRDDIESTLQAFVAHAGRVAGRTRSRRAAAGRARPHQHPRRQALPGRVLLVGPPRRRRARPSPVDTVALLRACASLELLHASALVHDDYMDASDVRRGRPATHRAFERIHREHGWAASPEQYGASAAILLGDLLLSWSDELLRTCGLPAERVLEALGYFDLTRSEVVAGQFLDVSAQARGAADVDTAMTVLRYKSAKYSIERPLHIGAALAGASAEQITQLSRFGLPLGEAFQLRDDLLGVFGDPAVTGKPAGDDLVEGKRTVLVSLALDALPGPDAKVLDTALGTALEPDQVATLCRLIEESGARQQVETVISELTDRSLSALAAAEISDRARGVLEGLAGQVTQRAV